MSNPDDEIDVWYVTPDNTGSQTRIAFDDRSEAIEYANEVLGVLFDGLGEGDCDTLTVERGKMKRSAYDKLEECKMSNPKWEIGPVKLVNGCDAVIHRFCEKRQRYLGEWSTKTGGFYAAEWHIGGSHTISGIGDPLLDLAPPSKKTVRVRASILVYGDGSTTYKREHELFSHKAKSSAFAIIEIDREVEEREGL